MCRGEVQSDFKKVFTTIKTKVQHPVYTSIELVSNFVILITLVQISKTRIDWKSPDENQNQLQILFLLFFCYGKKEKVVNNIFLMWYAVHKNHHSDGKLAPPLIFIFLV
jgi:hypothetical protein